MTEANTHATALEEVQSLLRAGEVGAARQAAERWHQRAPDIADPQYFVGVCQRAMGELDGAAVTLRQLITAEPTHDRALQEYGHVLRDQKQPAAALAMYRRATRQNIALIASWSAQASLCTALQDAPGAAVARSQEQWLRSLPKPLVVVMDLTARGRLVAAETLCKRFMRANPHHTEGMRLLADIALKLGATEEATLLLDTACRLAADDTRLQVDRVNLLRRCQQHSEARAAAIALTQAHPDNPQFQSIAAVEAMQVGDYDDALQRFEQVLRQLPDDAVTLTSKGHALKTKGDTAAAIESYQAALREHPTHGEAWYSLANLKTFRFSDENIATMRELGADEGVDAASQVYLQFALGKAFEDNNAWASSFEHYAAGNRIKRQASLYSATQMSEDLALQAQHCTPDLFCPSRGTGCASTDPIFIVGLPRAGSTLLEQILASHSAIDGTLELPNILALAQGLRRRGDEAGYPANLWQLTAAERQAMGERFIRETRIHRGSAPLFIDKMPNNFRHIGLIKLILPNARIIDARRHPLACGFSGFKQLFAEGQEFSYDLTDIGRYYRDYVTLMQHWNAVLPGEILQVNNEDVIADLPGEVARMLDFLGLTFEDRCLRYWETERAIKTPSSEQVRRPVSSAGLDQWRHYDPWLGPLKSALGPELTAMSE